MIRPFLFALCLCVGAPALAQADGPTDDDKGKAKRLVGQAQAAFSKGKFKVCAQKFEEANKLAPLPQIQFNLGLCYERLERYRDASLEYEAAAVHEDMPEAMRKMAQQNLVDVREHMSKVRIEGDEGESRIDGTIICQVPCEVYLEAGTHEVKYGPHSQSKKFTNALGRELVVDVKFKKPDPGETKFDATKEDDQARPDLTSGGGSTSGSSGSGPGFLTYGGGGLAVAGTAGALFFGLKTRSLHDDFMMTPTQSISDDGEQTRGLTNISIGVAVVGVSLVVYDLLID
jgi:hypothetical protein